MFGIISPIISDYCWQGLVIDAVQNIWRGAPYWGKLLSGYFYLLFNLISITRFIFFFPVFPPSFSVLTAPSLHLFKEHPYFFIRLFVLNVLIFSSLLCISCLTLAMNGFQRGEQLESLQKLLAQQFSSFFLPLAVVGADGNRIPVISERP